MYLIVTSIWKQSFDHRNFIERKLLACYLITIHDAIKIYWAIFAVHASQSIWKRNMYGMLRERWKDFDTLTMFPYNQVELRRWIVWWLQVN